MTNPNELEANTPEVGHRSESKSPMDAVVLRSADEFNIAITGLLPKEVRAETKTGISTELQGFLEGKPVSPHLLQHLVDLSMEQCGRSVGRKDYSNINEVRVIDPNTAVIRMHYGRDNGLFDRMSYWDIVRAYSHGVTKDRNSTKGDGGNCGFFREIRHIERTQDDTGAHITVDVISDRGEEKLTFDFASEKATV